jgi:hypothetical protein
MNTAVINPRTQRLENFTKSEMELDAYFISLTKQIEAGLKPSLSFEMAEDALASGRVSPDVIDGLEDAMFGVIMEERLGEDEDANESVSEEDVMSFLKQR